MTDAAELAGKVAIVTGGASGLGRGIVERFVEEGASVVIADVDRDGGEALSSELGAAAAFKQTDVALADQVQAVVDFAVERYGGLHVMCNNAGIGGTFTRFLDDDFADFDRVMAVNLLAVMVGSQRAARHMVQHGGGVIVNTTSIGGINAGAGVMAYRATKAAVIHFTRSIAVELARNGIRVNCVAPAHIPTAINASLDQSLIVRAMQPLQRVGSPRDVAEAFVFLASERAAQITGIVMPVDGGTTAGPPPRSVKDLMARPKEAG
ncbi:MAG TPA: SDR family oxidoreductase [Acidimicrobiia bacterium]|jgi:NAD(P)-dependent dehydrogenase (short-subunit alcohol dehydrogenase family)|nr:SDR family oxidoreductase [Acidimicrobiia bacterium]